MREEIRKLLLAAEVDDAAITAVFELFAIANLDDVRAMPSSSS